MPNTWTHILFVDQLCERIERKDLLETSSLALHIGAQGPDPFFYHRFLPFLSAGDGEGLGMQLHTQQCGPFLTDMIERGKEEKNTIQAYILGFVSHHYLDRVTHPYIHYYSGYEGNKHQELEVAIDTLMMQRVRNMRTWKIPVHKELKPDAIDSISHFLSDLIVEHYSDWSTDRAKKITKRSYKDMYLAQKLLFDPWYWKNKFLGAFVSSFSHQPLKDNRDYLNETKATWHHSATNDPSADSFLELYESAAKKGADLFTDILHYWSTPSQELLKAIEVKIGNISYDTGRPLEENQTNLYSSPIV
ncbi:zinc dependent phospholipase C family protein [Halobacillus salinus]|uniref:zinc dependent phospholipase C family protein n=1 Tax=Halobacillus salinus TaxID=192814 RepID=UPI001590D495|nr:zinc dependent phospholipase C family protein [Halobacillus salinus]